MAVVWQDPAGAEAAGGTNRPARIARRWPHGKQKMHQFATPYPPEGTICRTNVDERISHRATVTQPMLGCELLLSLGRPSEAPH